MKSKKKDKRNKIIQKTVSNITIITKINRLNLPIKIGKLAFE